MKHHSLAARYRPQSFAEVAGQDLVRSILSRTAAEGRPAPAYLLSGTRGVGKTTIARIFAKALNCERAPAPEPCNQCAQCRKITQGNHVDVTEIDGASNTGVDDVRALRETIGFAPMEGKYKIFIVDEAHMLSRNAFNALLKTLEEPPQGVVFLFATTELHRFPATILSRCQQFVFRHLGEDALMAHMAKVLRAENLPFEDAALRLLARRAAGSVRDGLSLLDQTLALGSASLTADATRQVLGLAGQDLFAEFFHALHTEDCAAIARLCRRLLAQSIDIGFFVRELITTLRTLFLLAQSGPAILPHLSLTEDEAALWQSMAPRFSAAHLHAAWQMALDAQHGVVHSLEPAAALELLLLNMALLPRLLPVGHIAPASPPQAHGSPIPTPATPLAPAASPTTGAPASRRSVPAPPKAPPAEPPHEHAVHSPEAGAKPTPPTLSTPGTAVRDWTAFCDFCEERLQNGQSDLLHVRQLRNTPVEWTEEELRLMPADGFAFEQMERQRGGILSALNTYGAGVLRLTIVQPPPRRTQSQMMEELDRRPELEMFREVLGGRLMDCKPAQG